ncbi:hypothetical protein BROC_01331 [Candidatus Brocadiaceae bacterium]|nr:hypothetical protein BROC_01331 [Candidatus Brocadiaceae bacterium]
MRLERIDNGGMFPFRKARIEELDLMKPFTIADFLQFYQLVDENLNAINYEVVELKRYIKSSKSQSETENRSLELQDKIYENLRKFLERDYKNAFVALTYDGKIMASDDNNVGLLEKLKELNYPSSQIFIRKVGATSVAGWI